MALKERARFKFRSSAIFWVIVKFIASLNNKHRKKKWPLVNPLCLLFVRGLASPPHDSLLSFPLRFDLLLSSCRPDAAPRKKYGGVVVFAFVILSMASLIKGGKVRGEFAKCFLQVFFLFFFFYVIVKVLTRSLRFHSNTFSSLILA